MEPTADTLIPTRATLLQRLKDWQDNSSWQFFFNTYEKLIFGVALKAGLNKSEAEEVVQETMIAVSKKIPNFNYDPAIGSFKKWLLNTTRWRIRDQVRKRPRFDEEHLPPDTLAETSTQTVTDFKKENCALHPLAETTCHAFNSLWDAEWQKNLLAAAAAKVKRQHDPQKYQIFDFYVNKGWPPEKVAVTFGVPISQVYLAKHRVVEMIAEEIKKLELEDGSTRHAEFNPKKPVNSISHL